MDTVPFAADKAGEPTGRFAPQLSGASMPTIASCCMLRLARQRRNEFTPASITIHFMESSGKYFVSH